MNVNDGKRLLNNAVLLTLAALFTKALSIGYRIPYQNITGDIGFYIYQQVYPIHGIVFTLAMYGFPVVISKLLAERTGNRQQLLTLSFWVLMSVSILLFLLLIVFSPVIAKFVGDEELTALYRMMAFAFLFVPFISVLRGFFQTEENVLPTALSQISEQVVRVLVIVTLAFYFMNQNFGVYTAGMGAVSGSIAGGVASILTLFIFYIIRKYHLRSDLIFSVHRTGATKPLSKACQSESFPCTRVKGNSIGRNRFTIERNEALDIAKRLIVQGFAISIGALTLVFFQLVDAVTVLNQLKQFGLTSFEAKTMKGVYDRGQPLLQLGFTLATSLSLVIVPAIAKAVASQNAQEARNKAGFALKVTFVTSLAASLGLAVIIEPTNMMLFKDTRGSEVLAILGAAIFFGSLTLTSIAILQGVDKVNVTLLVVAFGLIVKIGTNVLFIPLFGIYAAAIATVLGFAFMAVCSLFFVHKQLQLFSKYEFRFFRIVGAVIGMMVIAFSWKTFAEAHFFTDGRLAATGTALSTVLFAVVFYFGLLLASRVFTPSELVFIKSKGKGVDRED